MNAEQLSAELYSKLVSLNYARKVNDFSEAGLTFYPVLTEDVKAVIKSFPRSYVDPREDLMGIESLDGKQQFYLFENENGIFLVDNQGYTYPRYITKLDGFEDEIETDDIFERMEGLIRMADGNIFDAVVYSLSSELILEGFTADQVDAFLQFKLEQAVNKLP